MDNHFFMHLKNFIKKFKNQIDTETTFNNFISSKISNFYGFLFL